MSPGTVTIHAAEAGQPHPTLEFDVRPDVAMRLRRIFAGVQGAHAGRLTVTGTPATLADVEWVLARYPLVVKGRPRAWLTAAVAAHAASQAAVQALADGAGTPRPLRLALPARPYQAQAAEILLRTGRLLVADELGLGKTIIALAVLSVPEARPAVVVAPPHLRRQWRDECARFLPGLRVHLPGRVPQTDAELAPALAADVVILSYYALDGWAPVLAGKRALGLVAFDECQELRHDGTHKYAGAVALAAEARYRLGCSATPIYNYGGEFFNVFEVLAPGALGTRPEFLAEWCGGADPDGTQIGFARREPRLRDPEAFGAWLRGEGLMIRRTRGQVQRELPPVTQVCETVPTEGTALEAARPDAMRLARQVLAKTARPIDRLRAAEELSALLRHATGVAKAPAVAGFVRMLVEECGEPLVLFGWHRDVYDIWRDRLGDLGLAWHTGTESQAGKRRAVGDFIAGRAKVLIMSLRSGAGVDGLQRVAKRVVFGELDWSPGVLEQCIGRLHRDGQAASVMAYYLLAVDGADPIMQDTLGLKRHQLVGVQRQFGAVSAAQEADPAHVRRLAAAYLERVGESAVAAAPER